MKNDQIKENLTEVRFLTWQDSCLNIGVSPEENDICVFQKPLAEINLRPHIHDFFSIIYVTMENPKMTVNGQNYPIRQDQVVFLQPNTVHTIEGKCNGTMEDSNIYIIVNKRFIRKTMGSAFLHGSVFSNFFLAAFFSDPSDVMIADASPEKDMILSLLQQMMTETKMNKDSYSEPIIGTCCSLLLYRLSRLCQDSSQNPLYYRGQARPEDILDYLRRNANTATIQETADYFHYSPNYISQLLKNRYDKTFVELRRTFQLENACTYLSKTDYPACNIAYLTGFESPGYFSRVFKKEYGLSPQEYRRTHQQEDTELTYFLFPVE